MKKTIISMLIISIITIITVFFWLQPQNNTAVQPVIPAATSTTATTETVVAEEEVINLVAEKPASFDGVEMVTYKSEYGFEITYPKEWAGRLIPSGTSPAVTEYYIYPEEIPYGPSPLFQISLYEQSLEEFMLEQYDKNLEKISINDLVGYKQDLNFDSSYSYFFSKNGILYRLILSYADEYNVTEVEALWILSTFKITE